MFWYCMEPKVSNSIFIVGYCNNKQQKNICFSTCNRTACSCFRFMSLMYQATAVMVMMASSTTSYPESLLSKCLDSSWQKGETLITLLKLLDANTKATMLLTIMLLHNSFKEHLRKLSFTETNLNKQLNKNV